MSKGQKITLVAVLLVIAFFFYTRLSGPSAPSDALSVTDASTGTVAGNEFLALLSDLQSIKLDANFFNDPVFTSLRDSSVTITPVPLGRHNPFAPLGSSDSL